MARRVSLPGADEFFRHTVPAGPAAASLPAPEVAPEPATDPDTEPIPPVRLLHQAERTGGRHAPPVQEPRRGSGREKHAEKITVYVSADELFDLEQARITLRRHHGVTADRGRIVREALAALLEDLEQYGEDSVLVRRLRDR